ncbi:hypothetical protein BJ138DRAFT_1107067 [Hygrophoropsis aurantiaca]|uniref:Uncharacterized protein n=1 Tax=Hygrophoropsis aurantiaca TaxID=72124 RepID=A0ACB7ZU09_9AGAM|nr:hypothetical protein BJ138DRAFT_1107067 [Hygrophoropsis aurantiaca]
MAKVARLRNEVLARQQELCLSGHEKPPNFKTRLIVSQYRAQLQQFREQKGSLKSEALVVALCTPEPGDRPAKFEVPAHCTRFIQHQSKHPGKAEKQRCVSSA